ncbi:hypothetical protein SATMO3_33690 [Sporomusa aerivorans]
MLLTSFSSGIKAAILLYCVVKHSKYVATKNLFAMVREQVLNEFI